METELAEWVAYFNLRHIIMFQVQTSVFLAFLMVCTSWTERLDTWHWADAASSNSCIKEEM